jgi:6-phosphogluconolactonase
VSEVTVVASAAEAAQAAAELFIEATAGAAAARGRALVALTGGSSASPLYAALRQEPARGKVPWGQLHLFTGDERRVPEGDPRSNWGLARRELLSQVPVPADRLHPMQGDASDPQLEAARLGALLREVAGEPPRFDLLLLGLGSDGHVLSLFAGVPSSGLRGDKSLVWPVEAPLAVEPKVARFTLTPYLLLTARNLVLQVSGAAKAEVLARALKGPEDLVACPAQWLRRASGRVVVIADEAAAKGL